MITALKHGMKNRAVRREYDGRIEKAERKEGKETRSRGRR
jgi:hypothetical protein